MSSQGGVSRAAKQLARMGATKGGQARAQSLSPEDRRAISRFAAEARWGHKLPNETHAGVLRIGGREIPCSVLEDGTRVFSTRGIHKAMGWRGTGYPKPGKDGAQQLPRFLSVGGLKPYIDADLTARMMTPLEYRPLHGGRTAFGYEATLLPRLCGAILDADKALALKKNQKHIAETAEVLIRGFAHVGIIALVDEATGYQADRARDELNKILEAYISQELLPWTKRFPDEFFRQVYRLHGWDYREGNHKRPGVVGHLVNALIYKQLPPGVLPELQRRNPPTPKGYRSYKHHQFLTDDVGHPHLNKQIVEVVTLMRVSDSQNEFKNLFSKAFPPRTVQQKLDLAEEGDGQVPS